MSEIEGGYAGRVLWVDLTKEKVTAEPLDKETAQKYVGTRGFTAKILWDQVGPEVDPLGPENILMAATGPLTAIIPGAAQWVVGSKSPLTGVIGFGTVGGYWGSELKLAGYDVIAIKGKASKPVYLWIDDQNVEIKDASHLWGKSIPETNQMVREDLGDSDIDVMAIGQAGENLIKFASVNATMGHTASYGMGAVMGSKNLKAVAVHGSNDITVAAPEEFTRVWWELMDSLLNDKVGRERSFRLGTTNLLSQINAVGGLGTRNYQTQVFEGADKISGETLCQTYLFKRRGCFGCPRCCDRFSVVTDGPYKGAWVSGPEYATLHAFGSRLGNDNLASIIKANQMCDEFGLDIYSTGGVIGFAMELYEKGIITSEETDRLVLEWGNHQSMIEMIRRIVYRQGMGDCLAEGVRQAAHEIGKGSEYYALEIKGKEYGSQDPRSINRYGLGCMVSSRGTDPNVAWVRPSMFTPEMAKRLFGTEFEKEEALQVGGMAGLVGLGKVTAWGQELGVALDLLGVCKLTYFGSYFALPSQILMKILAPATGFKMDEESMFEAAKRVIALERAYNIREKGLTRKDDQLPERFLKEPVSAGPARGATIEQDRLLDEYYEFEGWDKKTGWPTKDGYQELGLGDVADELERLKRLP